MKRAIRYATTAPPILGAAYVLALAAWAGRRGSGDDADLGDVRRAEAVASFIEHRFAGEITRMTIGIVATAIGIGLALGLASELLVRMRVGARRRRLVRELVENVAVVASVHAALVAWSMADSPQLYASRWYARGGLARTAQVLVTDVLGTRGVVAVLVVAVILYVQPARVGYLARRALKIARRPVEAMARFGARRTVGPAIAAVIAIALGDAMMPADATAQAPRPSGSAAAKKRPPKPKPPASANANANAIGNTTANGSANAAANTIATATAAATATATAPAPAPATNANAAAITNGRRMNVLLLAADSLRADRLTPRVAPTLSALAAKGTTFERAYVSIPRTFPSWVTILTGRHAHHHGVRSMFPTWEDRAKDFDALPERLAQSGYATRVVSDYAGDIFGRIDLGFARVDTPSFDFRQLIRQRAIERETPLLPFLHSHLGRRLFPVMRELNDAADPMLLADDVVSALRDFRARDGSPFFLTVFFSTAHFPYAAPAPFYAKYTDPSYRGRFKYHKPVGLAFDAPPDADDVRQIRALYDGSVSAIDAAVARVLDSLQRLGLADDTIVVVTADHGETLYEDGHGQGHGDHLFGDEGTHVPLVVVDPRVRGGVARSRVTRVVRDVDLAPTLYELTGVPAPQDLDGRSLAAATRGEDVGARLAFAETELWFTEDVPSLPKELRIPYPGILALTELDSRHNAEIVLRREMTPTTLMARHRMVRDERWKLLYVPTRMGVRYMLFDLAADPGETRDVAAENPAEVERLRGELWRWMLEDPQMEQRDGWLVPRDPAALARRPSP